MAVVFDEAELAELVHEIVDPRTRRPDTRSHHRLAYGRGGSAHSDEGASPFLVEWSAMSTAAAKVGLLRRDGSWNKHSKSGYNIVNARPADCPGRLQCGC